RRGIPPAPGPGTKPPGELAESVIRLTVNNTTGALSAQDYFSPSNAPSLDASDTDFGAGGPTGLPFGTTTYPDEVMQAGKDGRVFVLDRDNLGGREEGPNKFRPVPRRGRPVRGPVRASRVLRRHPHPDQRQSPPRQRLYGLRRQERLHARVQVRGHRQR